MCECHVRRHGRHSIFSRRFSRVQTGKAGWGVFQVVLGAVRRTKQGQGVLEEAVILKKGWRKGCASKDLKEVRRQPAVREWGKGGSRHKEQQAQNPARRAWCVRGHAAAPCGWRVTSEGQGRER